MSRLSEERIDAIASPFSGMGGVEDYRAFAWVIYNEGHKAGQERMRERIAKRYEKLEFDGDAHAIRNLEIEEPK